MLKKAITIGFLFFILLSAIGCKRGDPNQDNQPQKEYEEKDGWKIKDGISYKRVRIEEKNELEDVINVYKFRPEEMRAKIFYDRGKPKTVSEWEGKLPDEYVLIFNGGFFNEDYSLTHLNKIEGQEFGTKLSPENSSFLTITQGILGLSEHPKQFDTTSVFDLIQSFPVLIDKGEKKVFEDSGKLARRTVLAKDKDGMMYLFVSEVGNMSLYKFSRFIEIFDKNITYALNLDGGSSTGVNNYFRSVDSIEQVPVVVGLIKRN